MLMVETLCINAKEAILDLEKKRCSFFKTEDGKLAQRAYGGQTVNFMHALLIALVIPKIKQDRQFYRLSINKL